MSDHQKASIVRESLRCTQTPAVALNLKCDRFIASSLKRHSFCFTVVWFQQSPVKLHGPNRGESCVWVPSEWNGGDSWNLTQTVMRVSSVKLTHRAALLRWQQQFMSSVHCVWKRETDGKMRLWKKQYFPFEKVRQVANTWCLCVRASSEQSLWLVFVVCVFVGLCFPVQQVATD